MPNGDGSSVPKRSEGRRRDDGTVPVGIAGKAKVVTLRFRFYRTAKVVTATLAILGMLALYYQHFALSIIFNLPRKRR